MTHCYLIPMFNEAGNLELLFERLTANILVSDNFFLFVDDNSSDNSVEIIHSLFKDVEYHVIIKNINKGPGDSFNLGMEYLLNKYPNDENIRIITMEADNTSDIGILKDMIGISNLGYDLVLASVYAQGGGFSQTSVFRKVLSFVANMVFRAVFDIKILTLSSFYRVYSINLLIKIKKSNNKIIEQSGFICMLEILLKSIHQNALVVEVPMILKSDIRKGKSKMKIFSNSISYLKFLLTFKRNQL